MPEIGRANYQPPQFCQNDFFVFFGGDGGAERSKSSSALPVCPIIRKQHQQTGPRQLAPAPPQLDPKRRGALAPVSMVVRLHTSRNMRSTVLERRMADQPIQSTQKARSVRMARRVIIRRDSVFRRTPNSPWTSSLSRNQKTASEPTCCAAKCAAQCHSDGNKRTKLSAIRVCLIVYPV